MGGRGSRSGMASEAPNTGGGSFMSNQQNMEDYAVAVGMFDRDFMRTAEGRAALREFMDDEREAGLTERDMRQAIRDTGSNRNRGTGSSGGGSTSPAGGGATYQASEIPSRVQSYTTTGSGASGDWESRKYVTRNGDAIKEVTTYENGSKSTTTVMQNYSQYPQYNRTRAQFESELAKMAKADARTGGRVTAVDGKKKGLSQSSRDTIRNIEQGARQRQRRDEANRRAVRRGMGL